MENASASEKLVMVSEDARVAHAVCLARNHGEEEVAAVVKERVGEQSDVAVVVTDLGDTLGVEAGPKMCRHLRGAGALTLAVAMMPRPCGNVRVSKSVEGLAQLRAHSSSTIYIDTSTLATSMSGATVLDAHNLFSEMVAFNLHSLLLPLIRPDDFRKISLEQFREVFRRNALDTRGRLARLVCAQATLEHRNERGKAALKNALTDVVFPLNDLSTCASVIVSIDSSKDLTYNELEQVMDIAQYIPQDATIVDGLSFSGDVIDGGVKVTLCVVEGDQHGLTPTELREDELVRQSLQRQPQPSTAARLWQKVKEWW